MVGLVLMLFWASLAHFILLDILGLFHFLGHPRPISFPQASPTHSNPSFTIAFTKSFRLPRPKLPYPLLLGFIGFPTNSIYLVSSFGLIRLIFAYFPVLIMSMGWLLLSLGSFGSTCFFKALLLFYRPMDYYSCHSSSMVFFLTC